MVEMREKYPVARLSRLLSWGIAIVIVALLGGFGMTYLGIMEVRANQTESHRRCRSIIAALRVYAGDQGGLYPDGIDQAITTSNEAFRTLFREELIENETVFSLRGLADGDIGQAPDHAEALEPGENDWAMTKGLSDLSPGGTPMIFIAPVAASWPPVWDAKTVAACRSPGKVVIGFNDSSVQTDGFLRSGTTSLRPATDEDGKNVFTRAAAKMEILNVER